MNHSLQSNKKYSITIKINKMKKTILTYAFGFTCSFLFAQAKSNQVNLADSKTLLAVVRFNDLSMHEIGNAAKVNDVSNKAIRDFKKNFKDAKDEKWFTLPNGYLAEFMLVNRKDAVVYDKKGNWKYTICYYDEKNLPDAVRAQVKSVYYDYSISRVEEIRVEDKIIYLVHMQNETTWKNLRICDGEMEVIEDYNKK
jgi:hypothetical protein